MPERRNTGMLERRNAGTPERRNAGLPQKDTGTPEHRNTLETPNYPRRVPEHRNFIAIYHNLVINVYFSIYTVSGEVTRIRPSGADAIPAGFGKRVIVLPVKRPSKENCWTRLLP